MTISSILGANPTVGQDHAAGIKSFVEPPAAECQEGFIVFELIIQNLPYFLFLVTSYINYKQVQGSGFNRVIKYSVFFKCKLALCALSATLNFIVIIVVLADVTLVDAGGDNYQKCLDLIFGTSVSSQAKVKIFVALFRFVKMVTWLISFQLLVYLYQKGLSESWYSHKMFWILSTICSIISLIWQVSTNLRIQDALLITVRVLLIIMNILLIYLMFKTKARSIEQPRSGLKVIPESHIFIDNGTTRERKSSLANAALRFFRSEKSGNNSMHIGKKTVEKMQSQSDEEPKLEVKIAQRTKEHPSDDFKLLVQYRVMLSDEERQTLDQYEVVEKKHEKSKRYKLDQVLEQDPFNPDVEQRQSLLEKSRYGLEIKKEEVKVSKNTQQILILQQQVKEQYIENAQLVQVQFEEREATPGNQLTPQPNIQTNHEEDTLFPVIEQRILDQLTQMSQQLPISKNFLPGQQQTYVTVTQIFDQETQDVIKSLQKFFNQIAKDKLYWTKDILKFFAINDEDIPMFLTYHEAHKMQLRDIYNNRNYNQGSFVQEQRHGSYWDTINPLSKISKHNQFGPDNEGLDKQANDFEFNNLLESARSNEYVAKVSEYHQSTVNDPGNRKKSDASINVDIMKMNIVENYMYGPGGASSNFLMDSDLEVDNAKNNISEDRRESRTQSFQGINNHQSNKQSNKQDLIQQDPSLKFHFNDKKKTISHSLRDPNLFEERANLMTMTHQQEMQSIGRKNSFDFKMQAQAQQQMLFNRPLFRVQFIKWNKAATGDYIEFQICVQTLEGARNAWTIFKRYTEFVRLHDQLAPKFKLQINNRKAMSMTDQIIPILPPKIDKQNEDALNIRQDLLEKYMNQVVQLLSGQVQFNQALINFLGFQPYCSPTRLGTHISAIQNPKNQELQPLPEGITPEFFNIQKFFISSETTIVKIVSEQLRLDKNNNPKTFYVMQVFFKEKQQRQIKSKNPEEKGSQSSQIHTIMLEKVYDDFKRLHEHVTETFLNEINEFEKHQKLRGQSMNEELAAKRVDSHNTMGMSFEPNDKVSSNQQQFLRDTRNFGSMQNQSHLIDFNDHLKQEHAKFGQRYFDEAIKFQMHTPKFPSKYLDPPYKTTKVNSDQLMENIEKYMNDLLMFSPIISNLFYIRDFLTCNRAQHVNVQNDTKNRRTVVMNTMVGVEFDSISKKTFKITDNFDSQTEIFKSPMVEPRKFSTQSNPNSEQTSQLKTQSHLADKLFLGGNANIDKSKNSINMTQEMDGVMDLDKESDNPNAQWPNKYPGDKLYDYESGHKQLDTDEQQMQLPSVDKMDDENMQLEENQSLRTDSFLKEFDKHAGGSLGFQYDQFNLPQELLNRNVD